MKVDVKVIAIFDSELKVELDKYISDACRALYRVKKKVDAIKLTRAHYNLGIFDAKQLCDWLGECECDAQIYY